MLDFNDLIRFTLYIMEHFEDALIYWQEKMNYIMVDEAQDCSGSDWAIVNSLAPGYRNLFIVGDPDQCIYEWRGAKPEGFLSFPAETDIILNQNYRSTPNILDVANSIIAHNENRIPKDLFTKTPASKIVIHYHGTSDVDESNWIATQIKNMTKEGATFNDFSILYRASYLSRTIEQALQKKQIKYVVWGGIRFFERREIKDIIAYFRLIAYKDDLSLKRVINTPSRKFGKASLKKLQDIADAENGSLYATLQKYANEAGFKKDSIINFVRLIDELTEKCKYMSVSDLFDIVLKETGLEDMYRTEGDNERLENIAELRQSIREYEIQNVDEDNISLETYLQDIALYTNADYKNDGNMVKIMTIHQSKGLEFPYVFVCGLSEGIFPSHRTIRERKKNGEEEERRLMYVATTRAERGLFLTESEGYNSSIRSDKFPSRFLMEINDGLTQIQGNLTKQQLSYLYEETEQIIEDLNNENLPLNYKVGDKVAHCVFGIGEIIDKTSDTSYKVKFEKGNRFIQNNFLKPWDGTKTIEELFKKNDVSSEEDEDDLGDETDTVLHAGDVINHQKYGKGVVEKVWGIKDKEKALVTFENDIAQGIVVSYGGFSIVQSSQSPSPNKIQVSNYINDIDDDDWGEIDYEKLKELDEEYVPIATNPFRFSKKKRNIRNEEIGDLSIGDVIEHPVLGKGIVNIIKHRKNDSVVKIDFESIGKVEFLMSTIKTKIKKISS